MTRAGDKTIVDARFEADAATLKLYAQDAVDLTVIASVLQDAVVRQNELTYLAPVHTFAGVFNRYRWEADAAGGQRRERVRAGVRFRGVLGVQARNLPDEATNSVLELLTIQSESGEDGSFNVTLVFSGGAAIRLTTECIDCEISDLGASWPAARRPVHPITGDP